VGHFRALVIGLFILSIPLALITTNVRVAISETAVYDYAVQHYGAAERSGIPESELLRANGEIQRYLTHDTSGPLAISVKDKTGKDISLFNARETAHMGDVQDVVQLLFAVQVASIALLLTLAVVLLVLWPPRALFAAALYGSLLTGGIMGMAAFIALTGGFDAAWSQFHGIVFSNDFWKLNPATDHLIQMFPEAFWQRITTMIGAFTLFEAGLISVISLVYLRHSRPEAEPVVIKPQPQLPGPAGHSRPRLAPPDTRHYLQ
jgi:integral membrane protein (TIGR01906 family)